MPRCAPTEDLPIRIDRETEVPQLLAILHEVRQLLERPCPEAALLAHCEVGLEEVRLASRFLQRPAEVGAGRFAAQLERLAVSQYEGLKGGRVDLRLDPPPGQDV